jgi:hypothetical protein
MYRAPAERTDAGCGGREDAGWQGQVEKPIPLVTEHNECHAVCACVRVRVRLCFCVCVSVWLKTTVVMRRRLAGQRLTVVADSEARIAESSRRMSSLSHNDDGEKDRET